MLRLLLSLLLAPALLWLIAFLYFYSIIPTPPAAEDLPESDAIVVLTGGLERIPYGLELIGRGKGRLLFISGVFGQADKDEIFQQMPPELKKIYRTKNSKIELGYQARDTKGNAIEITQWLRRHHKDYTQLLIVTDHFHMPRSMQELRRHLPENVLLIPAPVKAAPFTEAQWWLNKRALQLLLREYHKYLAINLHYIYTDYVKGV